MQKRSFFSLLFKVSILAMALPGAQNSTALAAGTLTMGTSADYPPYEFHDTSSGKDQIIGFDVDIARAIAKELGYELKVIDMEFNGLLSALQAKRVDLIMAGMTPTDERKKNADFSDVYYEAKNTIVALKANKIQSIEQLVGKKVGIQLGSIQEKDAKKIAEKTKDMKVVSLNKIGEIIQEIKAKRIDAAIIEDTVARGYAEKQKDLEFHVIASDSPQGSAIAFPKGSKHVTDFNRVLKKMKDSGELNALAKKWFDKK